MKDALVKLVNLINANWEDFVALVNKVWDFLKETVLKDDSIFATTKGE